MDDVTTFTSKSGPQIPKTDSQVFGVSVRAWLAIWLVGTVCFSQVIEVVGRVYFSIVSISVDPITQIVVNEPLYSMSIAALSFYFGHAVRNTPQQPQQPNGKTS